MRTPSTPHRQLLRFFRGFGAPYRRLFALGVGMRLCETAADLVTPWPVAAVIDHVLGAGASRGSPLGPLLGVLGTGRTAMLTAAAALVVLVALVSAAFDYAGDRLMNGAGERMSAAIRRETFAHLQRLPLSYHDRQTVGGSASRVITDCGAVKDALVAFCSVLFPGVLSATGYAAALLVLDWRFGLIGVAAVPAVLFLGVRNRRRGHRAARRRREAEGELTALVAEALQGIRTVHAFGGHGVHDRAFAAGSRGVLSAGLEAVDVQARRVPLLESVTAAATAALLWTGGVGVLRGWWSTGHLVVALGYLTGMVAPLRALSKLSGTFAQGQASAERVAAVLAEPCPLRAPVRAGARGLPRRARGRVDFAGVSMDYGDRRALHRLDLKIAPGERIALTGPNGAGKSTALALVAGLYRPTRGTVRIDGTATADLPEEWLRRQVTAVLQETFLFAGTIADNIRYARPDASPRQVRAAAEAALVTAFTDGFPDGLGTRLGDCGGGLSGGQRQRVGIARALLADAPIVLLDEPTSGLDAEAERLVVAALGRLVAHRTVVMVTHRPALLETATGTVALAPAGPARATGRPAGR
ncbi:ABC transporter ATP-binding protein [Streptomyces nondiastaticus]|uniref:ABC transporter ATP-binding protein n=1 Tax=Streptomyces nondiastaticus TaxID=3154512 RepID=A0ABW6TPV9_9ACTN